LLALGSSNIAVLLMFDESAGTVANIIKNFDAGDFTNDGKILVTGAGTTLTLLEDTLNDYDAARPPTKGGFIQVFGTMDGSAVTAATSSTLELKNTTIDALHLGSFNIDGLLKVDDSPVTVANIIKNFDAGDFTNDGKILVTGAGTTLTLLEDTLNDYDAAGTPTKG